jgi:hypothetical protein
LANVGTSGESLQNVSADVGESRIFPKNAILANARVLAKSAEILASTRKIRAGIANA